MTRTERIVIGLEVLLSVGALVGGSMLFFSPEGAAFGMPLSLLEHTGFETFRVPGLLLFVVNGVLPLVSAWATWRRRTWAASSVVLVGVALMGWILIQVVLLRSFFWPLHGGYLVLGAALFSFGLAQRRRASLRPHGAS